MAPSPAANDAPPDLLRVERARLALDVTRAALCAAAAVSATSYSKAINGRRGIRAATVRKLADALERLAAEKALLRRRLDQIIREERNVA
ncbi:MAG: helix-turn-helix domain-containing protein [Hyphomonadaceae bacterium]|nr:helix-turn-helix domain-containing protein [Hyphomonadaceae bacterium]